MSSGTHSSADQVVALTHGYAASRLVMMPLARRLRGFGYRVVNWGYSSLWKESAQHARQFRKLLDDLNADTHTKELFVVAHSMGSVLTRAALAGQPLTKLKRIVFLCPPIRGSHVATLYAGALGWFSKPLAELSDRPDSFVNRLPERLDPRYEVGIVRASVDFVVRPSNARMPGAKDYAQITGLHSSVLFDRRTANEVHCFLESGNFSSASKSAEATT